MGGCSTYQIRKIYAIGQALGIVNRGGEDALHDLVYGVTGKSSVKELSYSEACKVIGPLPGGRAPFPAGSARSRAGFSDSCPAQARSAYRLPAGAACSGWLSRQSA